MAKIHYPANLKIESVEEYSEAKVYKSNLELWNNNGKLTISIYQWKYLNQLPVAKSLLMINHR